MSDLAPVLLATCGLGILCVGLIVVGLFVLIRATGGDLMSNFGFLTDFLGGGESGDYTPPLRQRGRGQRPNFRERAQSMDFEAQVASKRPQQPPAAIKGDSQRLQRTGATPDEGFRPLGGGSPPPPTPQSPPATDLGDNYPGKYNRSPRFGSRRRHDRNQDEVFGGMLDEDGDGDLDF